VAQVSLVHGLLWPQETLALVASRVRRLGSLEIAISWVPLYLSLVPLVAVQCFVSFGVACVLCGVLGGSAGLARSVRVSPRVEAATVYSFVEGTSGSWVTT